MPEHARPCGTRPSRPPPAGDALSGCAPPAPRPLQARGQGRGVFPLERGVDDLLTMLSSFTHNSERGPGGAPEGARAADRKVEGRPNERIVFGRLQGEAGALRAFGARQPSEGIRQRFRGKLRVEPPQRLAEARLQPPHWGVSRALAPELAGRDIGSVLDPPAEAFKPGERGVFDDRFGEAAYGAGSPPIGRWRTRARVSAKTRIQPCSSASTKDERFVRSSLGCGSGRLSTPLRKNFTRQR